MSLQKPASRRHFTEAARVAAAAARKRKREEALPHGTPEVYVVRLPEAHLRFGWEIRRFGAVVLDRSGTGYPTMQDARVEGESALLGRGAGA